MLLRAPADAIIERGPIKIDNRIWVFKEFMKTNMLTYKVLVGPDDMRWVVPVDCDDAALFIFKELNVPNKHSPKNIGRYYFKTDEGNDLGLYDVFHSDAESLLRATGHDVVGMMTSFRMTSFERRMNQRHEISFSDILHKDTVIERYAEPIQNIAQSQANFYRRDVCWVTKNQHCTTTGVCLPEVIK